MHAAGKRAKAGAVGVHLEVHAHGQIGSTVVSVVKDRNLGATGCLAGNLYCVLNGFGTGCKEGSLLGKVSWCVLGD